MTQDRLKTGATAVVSGSEWGDTLGSVTAPAEPRAHRQPQYRVEPNQHAGPEKLSGKRPQSTEPGEPQNRTEV